VLFNTYVTVREVPTTIIASFLSLSAGFSFSNALFLSYHLQPFFLIFTMYLLCSSFSLHCSIFLFPLSLYLCLFIFSVSLLHCFSLPLSYSLYTYLPFSISLSIFLQILPQFLVTHLLNLTPVQWLVLPSFCL
jgi:hypothetical protein